MEAGLGDGERAEPAGWVNGARGAGGAGQGSPPLAHLRVLDLTRLAPGPYATLLLGDLGADVVTVEAPAGRTPGSEYHGKLPLHAGRQAREAGLNPLFRSRRSIVIDLKAPEGRELVLRLADRADVFLEGFRPGVCERLGLGYRAVAERNPGIVYCSLTGYGQDGELATKAGHDLSYLAETGLLACLTRPGQRPAIPLNVVADHAAGGLLAAFGILAALQARTVTGRGGYVDTSMYEGLLSMLQVVPSWTAAGAPDPSWGAGMLTGAVPFYDCYRTADDRWISVAALEPKFFAALCATLGRPDLVAAQFDQGRWEQLRAELTEAFAGADLAEWERRFAGVDAAVAPVRSVAEAFERAVARGVVGPGGVVGAVPRIAGWTGGNPPVVAEAGAHTAQILAELGCGRAEIADLLDRDIVRAVPTTTRKGGS